MWRSILAIGLASAVVPTTAYASPPGDSAIGADRRLGFGVSFGGPMGASVKYFIRPKHALQGQLGYGLLHQGDGVLTLEYLFHTRAIGDSPITEARFYIGLGIGMGFWARPPPARLTAHDHDDRNRGGAGMMLRLPVGGLTFHWFKVPLDTSLELSYSPYVVLPDWLHGDASIKVRYYFALTRSSSAQKEP